MRKNHHNAAYRCPHCGHNLRHGVREVRHNVTEVHHFQCNRFVRKGDWYLRQTESDCFGETHWECGQCRERLDDALAQKLGKDIYRAA